MPCVCRVPVCVSIPFGIAEAFRRFDGCWTCKHCQRLSPGYEGAALSSDHLLLGLLIISSGAPRAVTRSTCYPPFFPLGPSPLFCHHLVFATATLGECPISRHHLFSKHSSALPASLPPYKSNGRLQKGPQPASSSRASSTGPFRFSSADVSFLHPLCTWTLTNSVQRPAVSCHVAAWGDPPLSGRL